MDEPIPSYTDAVSSEDWEHTPTSVKQLVGHLIERLEQLENQYQDLQNQYQLLHEQVNRNSSNSSQSPSSDPPQVKKQGRRRKSGKKRGGQPGHPGHHRHLFAVEQCTSVNDYYPKSCRFCNAPLSGEDLSPYRHQTVEIPPVLPEVHEYRLHQRVCEVCGETTRAELPVEVSTQVYGPRVVAIVGVFSGMYRHSQRMVQQAMLDVFGIQMALGSINNLRQQASEAVAGPVEEAKVYAQQQPVVKSDETGFPQGNADGNNPDQRKGWLWVMVTPLVTVFQVFLSRSQQSAQALLGKTFDGILNSDRHSVYNWVSLVCRQVCWAHLKRDFTKIAERPGISQAIGEALLKQEEKLFKLWHRVRDGTLTQSDFIETVKSIRAKVKSLLTQGASYQIGVKEKTPLAKTVRTCRRLLKMEPALWLFVTTEGVEPTNNDSERALRPAIIWRHISFGTQTEAGSAFVARMLTVVASLRSQERNVLEYMTEVCRAAREGKPAPSLLPQQQPLAQAQDSPAA